MLYEIHTNDGKFQFEAPDHATAAFVTITLGKSMYKAVCVNDPEKDIPVLFANNLSWFKEKFQQSIVKFLEDNSGKIKQTLKTVQRIDKNDKEIEEDLELFAKNYIKSLPLK